MTAEERKAVLKGAALPAAHSVPKGRFSGRGMKLCLRLDRKYNAASDPGGHELHIGVLLNKVVIYVIDGTVMQGFAVTLV